MMSVLLLIIRRFVLLFIICCFSFKFTNGFTTITTTTNTLSTSTTTVTIAKYINRQQQTTTTFTTFTTTLSSLLSSSSSTTSEEETIVISDDDNDEKIEESSRSSIENNNNKPKFGIRINKPTDVLSTSYNNIVESAYVRHILFETNDMCKLVYKMLYNTNTNTGNNNNNNNNSNYESNESLLLKDIQLSSDPFGNIAKKVSSCMNSKDDGGTIGWIDNPYYNNNNDEEEQQSTKSTKNTKRRTDRIIDHPLLPSNAINEIFNKHQPKGGDVITIKSNRGVHLIRIEDILVHYNSSNNNNQQQKKDDNGGGSNSNNGGSNNKFIHNRYRRKLAGRGLISKTPALHVEGLLNNDDDDDGNGNGNGNGNKPIAKKYYIATNGCQMNVADSERMEGILSNKLKLKKINNNDNDNDNNEDNDDEKSSKKSSNNNKNDNDDNNNNADIVLINTCSIRDHAESKLYDQLGPYIKKKQNGETIALLVTGCVAQQEGEELINKYPEIDAVLGPQYVNKLDDILYDVSNGHQIVVTDTTLIQEDISRPIRSSKVKAWVNIIYGCNEHCTYCVVPYTRGVEQSRTMEAITKEILDLAKEGYKEVTLLGQNIDAYGRDMIPKRTFADLLYFINDAIQDTSMERVRYVTSHPRYFSDRVIDAVINLNKICEVFHVPFQSGDNNVLLNMRRGYTHESYMKIIDKIKKKDPNASICGDVIVGFPGETNEQFERTIELMNKVKFDNLNTFTYSPRPNTEASKWTNQISDEIKKERLYKVQKLAVKHAQERSEELYKDKDVEILVEERNPKNPTQVMGRTRQGRIVFFNGNINILQGKLVIVHIDECRPWSLTGTLKKII